MRPTLVFVQVYIASIPQKKKNYHIRNLELNSTFSGKKK